MLSLSTVSNSSLYTSTPAHRHSHLSETPLLLLWHPWKVHKMWLLIYTMSGTRSGARKIRSSFQSFHLTVLNSGTDPQHHNYSNDQQKIRKWSDFHPEIGVLVDSMNSAQPVRIKYHFQWKDNRYGFILGKQKCWPTSKVLRWFFLLNFVYS